MARNPMQEHNSYSYISFQQRFLEKYYEHMKNIEA